MNDQSETERSAAVGHWFGLDRLRLSDGDQAIDVTIGPGSHWDRSHLRRLRQSGDLPGMVPIIDSDFSADGKPFAVTPMVDAPTLASQLGAGDLSWTNGAGIAEAVARAIHEAHLRGLFHGAISPDDVHVIGSDVALAGVGLGLGGSLPAERNHWAAPEVRDGADPTERSDVYSLGKLLEASLGDAIDTAPRSIRRLIMWSSSDTPEARPPSAMEFASILAEGLGDERRTYGPAFISTSELSELAARASSAVSGHSPSETARATESNGGTGAALATGTALGAAGPLLASQARDTVEAPPSEGFSVTEAVDVDPGVTVDVPDTAPAAGEVAAADDTTELVSASVEAPRPRAEAVNEYTVPAAAQTVDLDETYVPRKQRSRAGLMVGGILALGVAAIAWGILTSGDDESDLTTRPSVTSSATTETTTGTTESTTSITEPVTATSATVTASSVTVTASPPTVTTPATPTSLSSTTVTTPTTATTAPATATTTPATATTAPATATTAPATAGTGAAASIVPPGGPVVASEAAVQVLHGVPGAAVDVYVDGKAIATDFRTGSIAGPIDLPAGSYDVALFAAQANPAAAAADRTDDALVDKAVTVGAEPATLVAHLDEKGGLALTGFEEQLDQVDPGQSRIMLRHLMATGPVDASVNGEMIGSLSPGEQAAVEIPAGAAKIEFVGADGNVLASATVTVDDGELASLSAIGSPGADTAEIVIQRYTGLSSAPSGVPGGDSGLLGLDNDQFGLRLVYGLMVALALTGGVVAFRRQRWS